MISRQEMPQITVYDDRTGFHLAIEILLISSVDVALNGDGNDEFQSRNRGSFDFKTFPYTYRSRCRECFNLVIEVLLISSVTGQSFKLTDEA